MTTKIKLIVLKKRLEEQRRRNVNCFYSVNIGGIIKLFKSESTASRWLKNMGYEMQDDCLTYKKEYTSQAERDLEKKFTVYH